MKFTLLGSGTSFGVPQMGCHCAVCTSADPRDRRLRCSALIQQDGTNILLDCGPDFREQMLRMDFCDRLSAVFITHEHYDHVGGIDDLRPFSYMQDLPIYADDYSCRHLRERLPYCWAAKRYPGVPQLELHTIQAGDVVMVGDVRVTALQVMHGKLPILGYRVGDVAYITDMTEMSPDVVPLLHGIRLLIVNGLRHEPHPTHQTVEHAIQFSRQIGERIPTYLIHMSHHVGLHAVEDSRLPESIHFGYDGLTLIL